MTAFIVLLVTSLFGPLVVSCGDEGPVTRLHSKAKLNPERLDFGEVSLGRSRTLQGSLENSGDAAMRVMKIELPAGFKLESPSSVGKDFMVAAGGSVPLTIAFTPSALGAAAGKASFTTDANNVTLDLAGTGVPREEGPLSCTPETVDFGMVERGASQVKRVTCIADGAPARLTDVTVTGMYFSVPTPPATVEVMPGGAGVTIDVHYDPEGNLAEHSGELVVNSSAGPTRVSLKGVEVAPMAATQAMAITLRWNTRQTDIDLHLVRPNGAIFDPIDDMHFRNRVAPPSWGPGTEYTPHLDADNTSGLGPENINLERAEPGVYTVYVHFYSDEGGGPSSATVDVSVGGVSRGTFSHQLACNDVWTVGQVNWDGSSGTFTPMTTTSPAPNGGTSCP